MGNATGISQHVSDIENSKFRTKFLQTQKCWKLLALLAEKFVQPLRPEIINCYRIYCASRTPDYWKAMRANRQACHRHSLRICSTFRPRTPMYSLPWIMRLDMQFWKIKICILRPKFLNFNQKYWILEYVFFVFLGAKFFNVSLVQFYRYFCFSAHWSTRIKRCCDFCERWGILKAWMVIIKYQLAVIVSSFVWFIEGCE